MNVHFFIIHKCFLRLPVTAVTSVTARTSDGPENTRILGYRRHPCPCEPQVNLNQAAIIGVAPLEPIVSGLRRHRRRPVSESATVTINQRPLRFGRNVGARPAVDARPALPLFHRRVPSAC